MKSGDVEEHPEIGENDAMSTQIEKLKAELEHERRARRKAEHANKGLAKELAEERRGREALERVCEELAKEISCDRASIERMRRDMEEERRMLRIAEVLREERVQMKLAEARIFLEEKISLLENKGSNNHAKNNHNGNHSVPKAMALTVTRKPRRLVLGEKSTSSDDNVSKNGNSSSSNNNNSVIGVTRRAMRAVAAAEAASVSVMKLAMQRKPSPEPENPHIKRGIKGFVEFPRVVRAIGSKSRHWGTKLECQKAQIRILLKQKSPLRSNHLIWGK